MKREMVSRPTQVYTMPLADGAVILHPELAIVKFTSSKSIDVGILCYSERGAPESRTLSRKVLIDSLSQSRITHVRRLLTHISETTKSSTFSQNTLYDLYSRLVAFIKWADSNNLPDVLADPSAGRAALIAYLDFLRDRVRRNELSLRAGSSQQSRVAQALEEFFGIDRFSRGLNLLNRDSSNTESTIPPSELMQGRVLSLCNCLFNGICDFVLEKKPYPYALPVPSYLSFPNDQLWVFPSKAWFKTPAMLADKAAHAGYNYAEGRLATLDELKIQYPTGRAPRHTLLFARKLMDEANVDFAHSSRWRMAAQALNAFMVMFLADTGMNWSNVTNLSWSDDYDVIPSRQGFRTIKWRARGRTVVFELSISFLPTFKRFLTLRAYLLQGRTCGYLFFKSNTTALDKAERVLSPSGSLYVSLKRIDPDICQITSQEWRAAKSDWLIRHTDPSTAALVLQNTEQTVIKHYAQGSETLHYEEMSDFLSKVSSVVLAPGEQLENPTHRTIGVCSSFGKPVPVVEAAHIEPDCDRAEGCLFCDKYRIHADEKDARKLLSCRYAIRLTAPSVENEEAYNKFLHPILSRIDTILKDIATREPVMMERVTNEVDEQDELDPYWASKVEMLLTLGF